MVIALLLNVYDAARSGIILCCQSWKSLIKNAVTLTLLGYLLTPPPPKPRLCPKSWLLLSAHTVFPEFSACPRLIICARELNSCGATHGTSLVTRPANSVIRKRTGHARLFTEPSWGSAEGFTRRSRLTWGQPSGRMPKLVAAAVRSDSKRVGAFALRRRGTRLDPFVLSKATAVG